MRVLLHVTIIYGTSLNICMPPTCACAIGVHDFLVSGLLTCDTANRVQNILCQRGFGSTGSGRTKIYGGESDVEVLAEARERPEVSEAAGPDDAAAMAGVAAEVGLGIRRAGPVAE
jgi:hypothetical protein